MSTTTRRTRTVAEDAAPAKNLAAKLTAIRGSLSRVEKTGRNQEQNYSFASVEDIVDMIRPALTEHGVDYAVEMASGFTRAEAGTTRSGSVRWHYEVPLTITLIDTDTGEKRLVPWWGEADEFADKGLSKATTAGVKSFLRHYFLISTGDDPDERSPEAVVRGGERHQRERQRPAEDEPISDSTKDVILREAFGAGMRTADGQLDVELLRKLGAWVTQGRARKLGELRLSDVGRMRGALKAWKDEARRATAQVQMDEFFVEHPEHLPEREDADTPAATGADDPQGDYDTPQAGNSGMDEDDDIPF